MALILMGVAVLSVMMVNPRISKAGAKCSASSISMTVGFDAATYDISSATICADGVIVLKGVRR